MQVFINPQLQINAEILTTLLINRRECVIAQRTLLQLKFDFSEFTHYIVSNGEIKTCLFGFLLSVLPDNQIHIVRL